MSVRKTISALSVAGLAVLGTAVTAPAAHAGAYGCAGNFSWSTQVNTFSGANAGTIYDYFDGTNNCSVFVKAAYAGTKTFVYMTMSNDAGTTGTVDQGDFSSYAGPVRVNGVGHCVREFLTEYDPSSNLIVDYSGPWHSC